MDDPWGHADDGEDLHSAAVRELEEESGIRAPHHALEPLADPKIVTNDKGETVEVQPFVHQVDKRPSLTGSDDPDAEIKRWKWVDISGGLPDDIKNSLHVPFERNALMQSLGLTDYGDKTMENCGPNLKKYMAKSKILAKGTEGGGEDYDEMMAAHTEPSDDDFDIASTEDDPLEDHTGPKAKMAMSNLDRYEKLKKGSVSKG